MKAEMKPEIAVVGTGRMGSALARAFLSQGYKTTVWNRTRAKAEALGADGARIAESVRDAVASAGIVVVNVKDYATSDGLLRPDDVTRALRGKLTVQLTSGSPGLAREAAAWAERHGVRYLDGAIMATPNLVGGPECTVLYAGPRELFEEHQPLLRALGEHAVHVGTDIGHASALDSAMLVVMWGVLFGTLQGVAICQAESIPLDAYLSYLEPALPLVNGWAADSIKRIAEGRVTGDDSLATLEAHAVGLRALLDLCKERGLERTVPEAFDKLFQAALGAGHAQDDFTILHKFMRPRRAE